MQGRSEGRMVVGHAPWYQDNPYQVFLKQGLVAHGIDVCGVRWGLGAIGRLIRRRGTTDVIHIHWPHGMYLEQVWRFPLVVLQLLAYRLTRNNVVWTVHELEFYETRYPMLDRIMVAVLIRISRQLIVHSAYSERMIRERHRFSRPITRILHPSYIECYDNQIGRNAARQELGFNDDAITYLFMGHIKPYKGIEDLIEAFKHLEGESVRLCVAGRPWDAEAETSIRRTAASDLRITLDLTFVPAARVQTYMNAADIVVLPFRKTHTSGSVLLAMSFARAVIVPALGAIPEYIDQSAAIFFDPTDPDGLLEALREAQRRDLVAMGRSAYARVADLNWRNFASAHAAVYAAIQ